MKIALVYDRVNKYGGAERILRAMHEIWPEAPLYTAVYNPQKAAWANIFQVIPSFLNKIPFASTNHELLAILTPIAFESFTFNQFDVVISITSAEAKYIITKPETVHICYCLTPTRYLWSGYETYIQTDSHNLWHNIPGKLLGWVAPKLRSWDLIGCHRPDYYVAISKLVMSRIEKYYQRTVDEIIYPPVDLTLFNSIANQSRDYYLTVARMVPYKRLDIVIDAFGKLGWNLVVIGNGREKENLRSRAKPNIKFIDQYLTDIELVDYYKNCRALVFAGIEDFGLVSVEAQAVGKPVFTYRESGMAETIAEGISGDFFDQLTANSLVNLLVKSEQINYNPDACRKNAQKFAQKIFMRQWREFVAKVLNKERKKI